MFKQVERLHIIFCALHEGIALFCYIWSDSFSSVIESGERVLRQEAIGRAGRVSGREEMLERIRKALGRPREGAANFPQTRANFPELGAVMPPIAPEDLVPRFEEELRKVAGCAHRASTSVGLDEIIRQILATSQATTVVLSRHPLLAQAGLQEKLRAWGMTVAVWPALDATITADEDEAFHQASFSATVGITGADFALAETGSLVLTSWTEGSQLASLAPPIHVALYRRSQVLGSLEEILERLPVSRAPEQASRGRSVVFVTGPSRTADIEQSLVRGVHGPREVHAILVEETCLI